MVNTATNLYASNQHALVVEDDSDIARLLKTHLTSLGYKVTLCSDGVQGLYEARTGIFDIAVVDIMLPGADGLEICKAIRSFGNRTPIMIVSSKSDEVDKVIALELGADDYMSKPFGVREFQSRVKCLARRLQWGLAQSENTRQEVISVGEMVIDPIGRTVKRDGNLIELTAKEFDLLLTLASNPGRVFSRNELLRLVWRYDYEGYEHTVNAHMNRLRIKVEAKPATPKYLLTVWGVGYKFGDRGESLA